MKLLLPASFSSLALVAAFSFSILSVPKPVSAHSGATGVVKERMDAMMTTGEAMKKINAETPTFGVLAALIAGAISIYGFNRLAHVSSKYNWLREWSMGFAIIIAMIVGTIVD